MYSAGSGLPSESFQLPGHDSHMSLSPSSPGQQTVLGHAHSSPFLPGYLLGDHSTHQHLMSSPRLWSSGSSNSSAPRTTGGQSGTMTPSAGSTLARKESVRTPKPGGPPTKSLFSSPSSPDGHLSQLGAASDHNRSMSSTTLRHVVSSPAPFSSGVYQSPRGDTSLQAVNQSQIVPVSPAQVDPFYTQGDLKSGDILDDTWVTVFGFPPGATSFILQQFSQYGTIIRHIVASECNWMHIHYTTKMQAKKALSKDGKIYGGCMKIGVTPCIEKTIMEERENQASFVTQDLRKLSQDSISTSLTPIRPLTAAYMASRGEYEVLKDKPTPKRDTSLVTKLKEYMFGW